MWHTAGPRVGEDTVSDEPSAERHRCSDANDRKERVNAPLIGVLLPSGGRAVHDYPRGRDTGGRYMTHPRERIGWRSTRVQISDELVCLFSAEVEKDGDRYVVEVPRREVDTGGLEPGEVQRVALIERSGATDTNDRKETTDGQQPPVDEGEIRYVEVEDLGKQGDGIARVERGYVIIVPGAEVGEQVKIEVTEVKSNFAVGEIIEEDL
ncbi:MAG: putative RNA-binding protein, contains TRAM domain protein [halophilic archaeon J07HB67]|nr:MAG: putative RNA-binding protein, contains TRAM domain protein [halophilic archaeon J07HB67]